MALYALLPLAFQVPCSRKSHSALRQAFIYKCENFKDSTTGRATTVLFLGPFPCLLPSTTPRCSAGSYSTYPLLRARVLAALHSAPMVFGSGGSRHLVCNHAHEALEACFAADLLIPRAFLFDAAHFIVPLGEFPISLLSHI